VVGADPSFFARRDLIVAALAERRIPAIYSVREYVLAGGLMSYAPDYAELGRRAARYVDRILKGAHPSELPIQQAERFELLVNIKAAAGLGIKVPPGLLVRADEVIE
jgi:putative ABC transport system substrate-binding protein